ncbi:MAG: undecaprenyl/decaprenyl-phosphate alpha-N-acetylglucosaminyl 1-phosphate transferase [Prevotella sp.]|nr:undecaprenyl/decaprenyl-phosphate alpha-N-acetylglucosaminyl 1-phosphate transferase [Prevotella sp.]
MIIPLIVRFCRRKGLYDHPDMRKIHKTNIPRLGGISFFPTMMLAAFVVIMAHGQNTGIDNKIAFSRWTLTFFISILIVYGIGIVDDILGLGAKTKFTGQAIAALLLPLSGLYVNYLYGFMGIGEIPFWLGLPLTVFVIVFACNAINLIDGIDGLSAGLSFIALSGFLVCFMSDGLFYYSVLIAGLMGVLAAYAYFNIWGKPEKKTKIFMGDSGSLTLGFILGFLFVKYVMVNPQSTIFHDDAFSVAFTLVIVPMFDVVRVSLARMSHHRHIFKADKNHIHHKLMRAGLTQHQTLCTILAMALLFIAVNFLLVRYLGVTWIVMVDVVLWTALNFLLNRYLQSKGQPAFLEI